MIQVRIGKLPNGKVPVAEVRDGTTRSVLMRMVENQVSTGERTKTLERAVVELQGRPAGSGPRGEDAEYWANKAKESEDQAKVYAHGANASKDLANASKDLAETAKDAAVAAKDAAVAAKDGAESAKAEAETAKSGAESAKGEAESARNKAQSYASNASSYKDLANVAKENAIHNAQQANNARVRAEAAAAFARWTPLAHNQAFANNTAESAAFLPMSLFVWDNKKTYDVEVRFVYWYRNKPKITSTVRHFLVGEYSIDQASGVQTEVKFVRSSITPSASEPIVTGRVETLTLKNVSPASYLAFINGSTKSITDKSHQAAGQAYWDVYIYIKEHSAS